MKYLKNSIRRMYTNEPSLCFNCKNIVNCDKKYRKELCFSAFYDSVLVVVSWEGYEKFKDNITVVEMAKLLGVSERTMYRRLRWNEAKTLKIVSEILGKEVIRDFGCKLKYKFRR